MILFVDGNLSGIFLLNMESAAAEAEAPAEEGYGEWVSWPQRQQITAVAYTVQQRQIEHIEATIRDRDLDELLEMILIGIAIDEL